MFYIKSCTCRLHNIPLDLNITPKSSTRHLLAVKIQMMQEKGYVFSLGKVEGKSDVALGHPGCAEAGAAGWLFIPEKQETASLSLIVLLV